MDNTSVQDVNSAVAKRDCAAWWAKWIAPMQEAILDRANICLLAAGVIYGVFRPFFEQLFSHYWVAPFLAYFQNGVLAQTVAWVVVIGIVVECGIACRNRKRISVIRLYRWVLVTAIWAAVRFGEAWSFVPWMGSVTYFDIVPFYALSVGVAYVCQFIKRKPLEVIEEGGFECDEPIETSEADRLGRSEFARMLARRLLKTSSSHQSFAVGILSPWGYGKTSFLNLIKDELKRYGTICIDFSPWTYGKENNLIREFFTEVGKHLRRYADDLPRDMMEYAHILEKSESTSWLSILLSLGSTGHSLEQQSNLLKQSLQKIDRPIVVFIDDLDRLRGNEVMEILKLIRNAANFSGIKFVAAYDRNYLVEAIKNQNIESASRYLEKIFQIEYTLPAFEHSRLIEYLNEECDRFIRDVDKEELRQIIDDQDRMKRFAKEELLSMRDVKRYANSLQNSYEKLAGNVVLCDLMNLEILRLMYKPVYDLLSLRWTQVLMEEEGILRLYESSEEREKNISWSQKVPSFEMNVQLKGMGYSEVEAKHIIRILNFLFPSSGLSKVYGAINNKDSIARYFYDTIQDYDLPIEVFKELWNKEYQYIKEEVDNIMALYQTASFVKQLDSFTPDSVAVCKKKIRIMFYVGSSSNLSKNTYKIISSGIISLNRDLSNDVEIKELLREVIKENGLSNYVSEFLCSEYHSLEKYFSFEEIRVIETDYLQEAIRRELPMDVIYGYISRVIYNRERDYEENERVSALIKEYAGRHVEEFLQGMVCNTPDDGRYSLNFLAKNVWGSWDKFIDYVKSITPRTPVIDEFEKFLEEFVEYGTRNKMFYKFKYIKIGRR